ncbi:hypothetical protein LG293_15835 (plasmid) [Citricoccus nitrophenolicus]
MTTTPALEAVTLPGKEDCPGHLQWSAFGANYPDTVCASVLEWPDGYQVGGRDEVHILWATDESPVPEDAEIHFHDGPALWWTATHPDRGEERVLVRQITGAEAGQ